MGVKERRQGHHHKKREAEIYPSALVNSLICSGLLSLFSFNLQLNCLFHYQDKACYYLFTGGGDDDGCAPIRAGINAISMDISTISPQHC